MRGEGWPALTLTPTLTLSLSLTLTLTLTLTLSPQLRSTSQNIDEFIALMPAEAVASAKAQIAAENAIAEGVEP